MAVDAEAAFRKTVEMALAAFCIRNEEFFFWKIYPNLSES